MKSIQACLTNIYCYITVKKNRDCCFTVHLHFNMYNLFKLENTYTQWICTALEELPASRPGQWAAFTTTAPMAQVARLGSKETA